MLRTLGRALCLALLSAPAAFGQPPPPAGGELLEPPPPPPKVQSGEPLEPEVVITRREEGVVTEYRIDGRPYLVKVQPYNAPPYYLVDADGDGQLDARRYPLAPPFLVPSWVLFRW